MTKIRIVVLISIVTLAQIYYSEGKKPSFSLKIDKGTIEKIISSAFDGLKQTRYLPDVKLPFYEGHFEMKNIKIEKFEPPKLSSTFSKGFMAYVLNKGSLEASGTFEMNFKIILEFKFGGSFRLTASDFVSTVLQSGNGEDIRYDPSSLVCNFDIKKFKISLSGGIVASIINMFGSFIANNIREKIGTEACNALQDNFRGGSVELFNGVALNYTMTSEPNITGKYMQTFHSGDISSLNGKTPFEPTELITTANHDKELSVFLSTFVPNSLSYHAHESKILQFLATPALGGLAAQILKFQCKLLCVGTIFPSVAQHFPNASAEVLIYTVSPPTINSDLSTLPGNPFLNVSAVIAMNITAVVENDTKTEAIYMENFLTTGFSRGDLLSISTPTGAVVDEQLLSENLKNLTKAVEFFLNGQLQKGIEVPKIAGVKFKGPISSVASDTFILSTDADFDIKFDFAPTPTPTGTPAIGSTKVTPGKTAVTTAANTGPVPTETPAVTTTGKGSMQQTTSIACFVFVILSVLFNIASPGE